MSAAPIINHPAAIQALRDCGRRTLAAADGRGVRWARIDCTKALQTAGHSVAISTQGAEQITRLAVWVKTRALEMQADLARGRA